MGTLAVAGAVFAAATLAAFALFRGLVAVARRPASPGRGPLLAGFAPELAGVVPFTAAGREDLRGTLAAAGEYRTGAAAGFVTLQLLLAAIGLVVALVVSLYVPPGRVLEVLAVGAGIALGGYFLPRVWLSGRASARRAKTEAGLPLALDLYAAILAAGGDLRGGLAQVARAVRRSHPVLADELALVGRHADFYTLGYAVRLWADRSRVPAVREFARQLTQAEAAGAGVSAAVVEAAGRMRAGAKARAEARANRLGFWLLAVTLSCFWTGAGILLFAPPAIQMKEDRDRRKPVELPRLKLPTQP